MNSFSTRKISISFPGAKELLQRAFPTSYGFTKITLEVRNVLHFELGSKDEYVLCNVANNTLTPWKNSSKTREVEVKQLPANAIVLQRSKGFGQDTVKIILSAEAYPHTKTDSLINIEKALAFAQNVDVRA